MLFKSSLVLLLAGLLAACTPAARKPDADAALGRANPGYVQWLERQSMLRQAPDLTAIVSGSSLAWNAPASENDASGLLKRADIWLDFSPRAAAWSGNASALAEIKKINLPAYLAAIGVHGLYISPTAESGSDWDPEGAFAEQAEDVLNFRFAPPVGKDEDWQALEDLVAGQTPTLLLGGDVLPAATGLGPDFFLATRGVRDYPGLYMMTEAPGEFWSSLPLSRLAREGGSSVGEPLPEAARAAMASKGVIPPAFSRDGDPSRPGGWAVTSEIVGVDGVNRRWLYRWDGSPRRAVLNWDDPSGSARRIFSASIIRQVGLLHQPLVGLSVAALWGQDPAKPGGPTTLPAGAAAGFTWSGSPEPALSALQSLSRDVRRYGAWSLLRDPVPAPLLPAVQAAGADFARDTVTSPALEYAMLTGDTAPLKRALADSLKAGVDHARLWRAPADGEGLRFEAVGSSVRQAIAGLADPWRHDLLMKEGEPLRINAFTLAAAVVGASRDELRSAAYAAGLHSTPSAKAEKGKEETGGPEKDSTEKPRTKMTAEKAGQGQDSNVFQHVRAAHMLQIAFRAMQPGLLMIGGGDVAGILALPEESPMAWVVDGSGMVATRQGLPADKGLYPPLEAQPGMENSFGRELAALAALRRETGVAEGRLAAVPDMGEAAAVGTLTRLPDGDYLLSAGNFSAAPFVTDVNFPDGLIPDGGPATDLITGKVVAVDRDHLRLRMNPWEYRIVRLAGVK